MGKIIHRPAARHPAMNLLIHISHPYDIYPQSGEISLLGLRKHSLEITAVESGGIEPLTAIIRYSPVVDIIRSVAIAKPVGYDKIDCRATPIEVIRGQG